MDTTESNEMYLETIIKLEDRNGLVRSIDIANELGYTKPSVSRGMRVLKEAGFITHERYGSVFLTEKGRNKATEIVNRHKTITKFLIHCLNIDADTAEDDACKIEHIISQKTANAIKTFCDNHINY